MRTEEQSGKIHQLAVSLLKKRGIAAEQASYEQLSDAYVVAAQAFEHGETTVAAALGRAAAGDLSADDRNAETTTRVLSRFAIDGRFVSALSIDEQELLEAAVAEEARRDGVIAAEARYSGATCPDCGCDWLDCSC